jgi:hypothetical protein
MEHTRNGAASGPTLFSLGGELADGAWELIAAHAEQIRSEFNLEFTRARSAGGLMAGGLVVVAVGCLFLAVTIVMVLIEVLLWPAWLAWLAVSLAAIVIGAACWIGGRQQWGRVQFVPDRAVHSLKETVQCLANGTPQPTPECARREHD